MRLDRWHRLSLSANMCSVLILHKLLLDVQHRCERCCPLSCLAHSLSIRPRPTCGLFPSCHNVSLGRQSHSFLSAFCLQSCSLRHLPFYCQSSRLFESLSLRLNSDDVTYRLSFVYFSVLKNYIFLLFFSKYVFLLFLVLLLGLYYCYYWIVFLGMYYCYC